MGDDKNDEFEATILAKKSLMSYMNQRKFVGAIAFFLPLALWLGNYLLADRWKVFKDHYGIQSSMSAYYYTSMRNLFVGALCSVGVFLVCSKDADTEDLPWWKNGTTLYRFAGGLALAVPFLPTRRVVVTTTDPPITGFESFIGDLHFVAASVLFITLAWICLTLFTKKDRAYGKDYPATGTGKTRRNWFYKFCAVMMGVAIIFIWITTSLKTTKFLGLPPTFLGEWWALAFFGLGWAAKGLDFNSDFNKKYLKRLGLYDR